MKSKAKSNNRIKNSIDLPIFYTILLLVIIGIVMVFSASFVQAKFKVGDSFHFLKKNIVFSIIGTFVMLFVSNYDYRRYKKLDTLMLVGTFLLLCTVLWTPLGKELNNAKRWIMIGPITLMPSEIAKFTMIFLTAKIIENRKDKLHRPSVFIMPMFIALIFAFLIIKQPNLSTAATIVLVCFTMLFIGGIPMRWVTMFIGAGVSLLALMIAIAPYRLQRFMTFLDPFKDPQGEGFQVIQSLYALGSGGMWGLGLGKSRQKYFYLPEPQNDFIFSIIGEELGYIGCVLILLLFAFLIFRCIRVALKAPDLYSSMIVIGITAQLTYQVLINVGVATSSIPNTGIALPFISYGGTSLVIFMGAMGVILNVSRYMERGEKK